MAIHRSRTNSPRERLVYWVQELERLEEEKKAASDRLSDAFSTAKADGFDTGTLKVVLKLRKMTPEQRRERRALEAIYLAALGMLEGNPLPDEARRRLDGRDDQSGPAPAPPPPAPTAQPAGKATASKKPAPRQAALVVKDPDEARQEGRDAAVAGKRIYDNPFPAGDPCRAAWDEGWCEQQKSHGMDLPAAYQRRDAKPPDPQGDEKKGAA